MSSHALLSVHGVRVLGHASAREVAALYDLDAAEVEEHLLDAEARGHVRRPAFVPSSRWSVTDLGREHGERLLAEELDGLGVREQVAEGHRRFVPLNRRLGPLMTRWQLRPTADDPLAANDHTDHRYDDRVLRELDRLAQVLGEVTAGLRTALPRLGVHQPRVDVAVASAVAGDLRWVDSPEVASVNLVWIQLHEDLLATLGLQRGEDV
ncbi:hypothetical protein GCM10009584_13720 [Ornithinimicrobium humiphilum]|uniref:Uncharacterized protein n=1 Tax=Ornithinimicrobium humiphilum TaxID=125288 RepID=A0A543KK72_9MICO|nr:transcriptional regulator [Ornithinimicrobium humiphilum]TQM95467.1 hypothetical protein FB476_0310 [Ornithinimicrobium humiphilum]